MTKAEQEAASFNRSISDKTYDLLGDMLIERETTEFLAEIEDEKERGDTAEMDAFFKRFDAKNLAIIDREYRRGKRSKFFRQTLPKFGQAAAVFIAVLSVTGGIALAASSTVRIYVKRLLTVPGDEYTEIRLEEDVNASFDIPSEWGGENYPAYVPEGFALGKVNSYPGMNSVSFADSQTGNQVMTFAEYGEDIEGNIDTENATVDAVMIHNNPGFLAHKESTHILYWSNGRVYFTLTVENQEESTVLHIAKSVVRVD